MAWVRIDDHFDEHPKMQRVGPLGWGFWLAGLAYCNRNLTDGFIPWNKARTLCSFEVAEDDGIVWDISRVSGMSGEDMTADWLIGLLIGAGLWEEVRNEKGRTEGYCIHDYQEYQPLKAQIEEERAKKVAAGQAGGRASAQARAQAPAETPAQAKSKQSSTPNPIPSNQPSVERDAPKPVLKALPRNGPAQSIVAAWYACLGGAPVSYPKAVGLGQKLADLGCTEGEVAELYDWMGEQEFFQGKFDMGTAVTQFEKFRQSKKPRRRTGAGSGIPA
jgi:hypothetical protein